MQHAARESVPPMTPVEEPDDPSMPRLFNLHDNGSLSPVPWAHPPPPSTPSTREYAFLNLPSPDGVEVVFDYTFGNVDSPADWAAAQQSSLRADALPFTPRGAPSELSSPLFVGGAGAFGPSVAGLTSPTIIDGASDAYGLRAVRSAVDGSSPTATFPTILDGAQDAYGLRAVRSAVDGSSPTVDVGAGAYGPGAGDDSDSLLSLAAGAPPLTLGPVRVAPSASQGNDTTIKQVVAGMLRRGSRRLVAQRPCGILWEFPGGKVEEGESFAQALCRELEEEIGVIVSVDEPRLIISHAGPRWHVHVYEVVEWEGEPYGALTPPQKIQWLELPTISTLDCTPSTYAAVDAVCPWVLELDEPLSPAELRGAHEARALGAAASPPSLYVRGPAPMPSREELGPGSLAAGPLSLGPRLHVGSAQPHVLGAPEALEPARFFPGSMRQLEPELPANLLLEPLPETNVVLATEPEAPPPRIADPPGPFTTEELIPQHVYTDTVEYGRVVSGQVIPRAQRGDNGWRRARDLRPDPVTYTEKEALNECGWGYIWEHRADKLWYALQPTSYPDDPPETDVDLEHFIELADREGLVDQQELSWQIHGFPGARRMIVRAQLAPPHVGALRNADKYVALCTADEEDGFVTHGFEFPDVWPSVIDPTNVVVQKGKGRMTIDKTMHCATDPELLSYNESIDLPVDEAGVRYKLVRVWQLARALAIFSCVVCEIPDVDAIECKLDLKSFFRFNGKQRAHRWQSGRLTASGFGSDLRVAFGECDAPDHMGRASNAICFFIRRELKRLEAEYPTVIPALLCWLDDRRARRGGVEDAEDYLFAVLFFLCFYVDDGGASIVNDPLYRRDGSPLLIVEVDDSGVSHTVHQRRGMLYYEAMIGVIEYVGHKAPMKKRVYPCKCMEFLGIMLCEVRKLRYLPMEKQLEYGRHVTSVLASPRLSNGRLRHQRRSFISLVHRLLHASEVIPLGRSHCYHLLECMKTANRLESNDAVVSASAERELLWWAATLESPVEYAVPLASRLVFPDVSADGSLVHYGDASREYDESTGVAAPSSGLGAWAVIGGVFVYIVDRWSDEECARYSINVLELATLNMGAMTFVDYARRVGEKVSHVHSFVDNTCAEFVAERGRTSAEGVNQLNQWRQSWLVADGVHQQSRRVASIFNDVADLLSRGDIEDALRFAVEAELPTLQLPIEPAVRDLSWVAPTWA